MPISYDLAKRLKNAGFPNMVEGTWEDGKPNISIPDLSELIEACGEKFYQLLYLNDKDRPDAFRASTGGHSSIGRYAYGQTPKKQ